VEEAEEEAQEQQKNFGLVEEAEEAALFGFFREQAGGVLRHFTDGAGDGRVDLDHGCGGFSGSAGGGIVVGNLPLRGAGENFGDFVVVEEQTAGLVAVEDDLQVLIAGEEEFGDHAIGVAQLGDADLGDEVNGGGGGEKRGRHQVQARAQVDDDIIEALAGNGD